MSEKIQQFKQFLRWFWQIAKDYFLSSEKFRAWGLLALVIVGTIISRPLGLQVAIYTSKITTALSQKDFATYKNVLLISTGLTVSLVFIILAKSFLEQKFSLYWRQWLTNQFLNRYLGDRHFYHINNDRVIDNPDQRISQDINSFIDQFLNYLLGLIGTLLSGFLYIGTLWKINNSLVFIAIATAIIQTLISYFIGRVLTPLNFKSLKKEMEIDPIIDLPSLNMNLLNF